MSEKYGDILEGEYEAAQGFITSAYGPMILPFLIFAIPLLAAIVIGVFLNWYYPYQQPGVYGWLALPVGYFFGGRHIYKHWRRAIKGNWFSPFLYWMGKLHVSGDLKILSWEQVDTFEKSTEPDAKPGTYAELLTKYGKVKKPSSAEAGDLLYAYHFENKNMPVILAAQKDVPERMFNFVGNASLVISGGLMFQNEQVAACAFVRTDFTKTDDNPFIPIGVFSDYSQQSVDIRNGLSKRLPAKEYLEKAAVTMDGHYSHYLGKALKDERALREASDQAAKETQHGTRQLTAKFLKTFREGGNIGGVKTQGTHRIPGTLKQWVIVAVIGVLTAFTILRIW